MSIIPKQEGTIYGGEGEDIFNLLTPYIERAGYKWELSTDAEKFTHYLIEKE